MAETPRCTAKNAHTGIKLSLHIEQLKRALLDLISMVTILNLKYHLFFKFTSLQRCSSRRKCNLKMDFSLRLVVCVLSAALGRGVRENWKIHSQCETDSDIGCFHLISNSEHDEQVKRFIYLHLFSNLFDGFLILLKESITWAIKIRIRTAAYSKQLSNMDVGVLHSRISRTTFCEEA